VTVLTVTQRNDEYAKSVYKRLRDEGIRAELDIRNEKLGFKIREAQLKKIPYQLVIGDNEAAEGKVAPRQRGGESLPPESLDEFVERVKRENRP